MLLMLSLGDHMKIWWLSISVYWIINDLTIESYDDDDDVDDDDDDDDDFLQLLPSYE